MTHRFHPEALEEWHQAAAYYEDQREGLGAEFARAVRDGAWEIVNSPTRWPAFAESGLRAYRLTRFPYRLVYAVFDDVQEVLIASVMHTKRESSYLAERRGQP